MAQRWAPSDRNTVGGAALLGGALAVGGSLANWFIPSLVERGYSIIEQPSAVALSFSASLAQGGLEASVSGTF